ncbi:MAG: AAA family ATPase [Propionibacteriaceae bacterium]|jgi:stage V sporulation protein K|nr:AAA family ATPase [Propionibacteriaceae bacterium]
MFEAFENCYTGELRFASEPDWDAVAAGLRMLQSVGNSISPRRVLSEDGSYILPFAMKFGRGLIGTSRSKKRKDKDEPSVVEQLTADLEAFFNCSVALESLVPSIERPDDLKALEQLCEPSGPWGMRHGPQIDARRINPNARRERSRGSAEQAAPSKEQALTKLDALIGLEPVKQQVREIVDFVQQRGRENLPCLHMVFRGNPGTGKTTVARIIAEVFAACGVTSSPQFVETDRSGLVGQYIGHTAQKTSEVLNRALGGVLFIDEAYSLGLYDQDLGMSAQGQPGRRDFGPEAIDTLVKAMEDKRDKLVCIMAGYPAEMDRMLDVNPGLRDRVAFYIDFPDYNTGELLEVFRVLAAEKGYTVSPKAAQALLGYFAEIKRGAHFSNGRISRKVFERAALKQSRRTSGKCLANADVEAALADLDLAALRAKTESRVPVGFAIAPSK